VVVEAAAAPVAELPVEAPAAEEPVAEVVPKPRRGRRKAAEPEAVAEAAPVEAPAEPVVAEPAAAEPVAEEAPKRRRRRTAAASADQQLVSVTEPDAVVEAPAPAENAEVGGTDAESENNADGSPRRGWWQRTFGA
jgi:ribonuclease E